MKWARRTSRVLRIVSGLGMAGCFPDIELATNASISCEGDTDCPEPLVCAVGILRCVPQTTDEIGPRLLAVTVVDAATLRLSFDEALAESSAAEPAHYIIEPALAVLEAKLDEDQTVELTVATHAPGVEYTVSVSEISDWRGNVIDAGASQPFVGYGTPPDTSPPTAVNPQQDAVVRGGGIFFAWAARTGAQSYTFEIAADTTFSQPLFGSPFDTLGTSILVDVNGPAQTYYWRVTADVTAGVAPPVSFETYDTIVRVYCAAVDDCTTTALEAGNLTRPFRSIGRALAAAQQRGHLTVRIASRGGSSTYDEAVSLPPGVNVTGGWAPTFMGAVADQGTDPTSIRYGASPPITIGVTPVSTSLRQVTAITTGSAPALRVLGGSPTLSIHECRFVAASTSTAPALVAFASDQNPEFMHNVLDVGPLAVGVLLENTNAQVIDNDIDMTSASTAYERTGISVRYGGNALVTNNRIELAGGTTARGIDIAWSGGGQIFDNRIVVREAGQFATGISVMYSGSARVERNQIFVYATGSAEASALYTWQASTVHFLSNVVYASGPYAHAANLVLSEHKVALINNTLLVSSGNRVAFANATQPIFVNNVFAALGPAAGSIASFEAANSRPQSFQNNLLMNIERPYVVNGVDTDVASLDDPTGSQGTWARVVDNIVAPSLLFADVFVDADGPDDDLNTWEDNNFALLLTSDPNGIASGGLDVSTVVALPECFGYNVPNALCMWVGQDVAHATRTPPLSIGAYEKD